MLAISWAIMTAMHKLHVVLTARKLSASLSLNSMGEPYPKRETAAWEEIVWLTNRLSRSNVFKISRWATIMSA